LSTVGIRELSKHASAIIHDVESKKEPALITRRGRPVAYVLPVDSQEFEDFVLAHAPQFVASIATADAAANAGDGSLREGT
jgi:prevent-host-death family protein